MNDLIAAYRFEIIRLNTWLRDNALSPDFATFKNVIDRRDRVRRSLWILEAAIELGKILSEQKIALPDDGNFIF